MNSCLSFKNSTKVVFFFFVYRRKTIVRDFDERTCLCWGDLGPTCR